MPGSQDVLHFVKNILEHFSVNNLDEDLDCLVSAQPDQQARAEFVVDVAAAFETEGASPEDIVNQLADLASDLPCFSLAACAPPTSKPLPASSCPPYTPGAPPTPTASGVNMSSDQFTKLLSAGLVQS